MSWVRGYRKLCVSWGQRFWKNWLPPILRIISGIAHYYMYVYPVSLFSWAIFLGVFSLCEALVMLCKSFFPCKILMEVYSKILSCLWISYCWLVNLLLLNLGIRGFTYNLVRVQSIFIGRVSPNFLQNFNPPDLVWWKKSPSHTIPLYKYMACSLRHPMRGHQICTYTGYTDPECPQA